MIIEIIKFFLYGFSIVIISKYILVKALRGLAENLKLEARTVGIISGVATSIPEFLTVTISSIKGLVGTSIYNILSSNIINFIQYIISIIMHKNQKQLKYKGIFIQLVFVYFTILIPMVLLKNEKDITLAMAVIFIIMYFIFSWIIKKVQDKYIYNKERSSKKRNVILEKRNVILRKINEILEKINITFGKRNVAVEKRSINKEKKDKEKYLKIKRIILNRKNYIYYIYIIFAGILLYIIGNALGNVLENLAEKFRITENILGVLLGFITSIPELITFFESQKHYKKNSENETMGVVETTNNLLTSNMLNLFIIQALGIIIYTFFGRR